MNFNLDQGPRREKGPEQLKSGEQARLPIPADIHTSGHLIPNYSFMVMLKSGEQARLPIPADIHTSGHLIPNYSFMVID